MEHHETEHGRRRFPLIVACDDWTDGRNVGGAFRLADAFGVQALWLGGDTPRPPHKYIGRTSRGAERRFPFEVVPDLPATLRDHRRSGKTVIGLEITTHSQDIAGYDFSRHPSLILVVGGEKGGLSPAVLREVDACVHIPMFGELSSLNVVTALAVGLYEITRQWR